MRCRLIMPPIKRDKLLLLPVTGIILAFYLSKRAFFCRKSTFYFIQHKNVHVQRTTAHLPQPMFNVPGHSTHLPL